MSKKITTRKIQEKWNECPRKRKTAIMASLCAVLVFGIGITVLMSSGAFYAIQSSNTPASQPMEKKEAPGRPQTQAPTPPAQPDGKPSGENHPGAPSNDQQGNHTDQQNEKSVTQISDSVSNHESDHSEPQVPSEPDRPANKRATQVVHEQREQKHEPQPSQSQPQPANQPAKKRGHWETVVEKPAWDEPIYETVTDYKLVGYYVFNYDGYRTTDIGKAAQHGEELALAGKSDAYHGEDVKEPIGSHREQVDTIHHEAVTRQVWVED